jgi:hypothetical protein
MIKKTIAVTRSDYAQRILYLDGKPFSVQAVPFMIPILNCPSERMILQTGRQVGKSTTLSASILTGQTAIPHHRTLYVAPRNEQVVQFSKDRLSHMIAYSPLIQRLFVNSKVQQQVKAKEFTNGSMVFLRSCYHTADGIRGISANDIYFDEIQDIILDNIPVVEECAARKSPRRIIYCGTPKTFDNPIAKIWESSTQHYWAIKCRHCGHWNVPIGLENIGPDFLVCAMCKKQIYSLDGEYVAKYPSRTLTGFHISQAMIYGVPGTGLPWQRIIDKMNDPLYGMGKFMNECLGFSYDSGAKLLTETDLRNCCDPETNYLSTDRKAAWGIMRTFAGVDWGVLGGNTHTVLTIGGVDSEGRLRLLFAKKYPVDQDPVDQVEDVCRNINAAGCAFVCADRGGGHVANAFLRKKLTWAKVHEIEYKARVNRGMYYDEKSKTWITDRTRALAGIIIDIKNQRMLFPEFNLMNTQFFTDLLTLSCEYNDKIRAYQILRQVEVPDDFAHSLVYLRLAARKIGAMPTARHHTLEDFMPFLSDEDAELVIDSLTA